ncbi:MAG TPA: hypothetical protein VLL52_02835 [Anaerolineae bacterium]|nr:hypothetical protein [Anaerolineae bacterium]
MTTCQSCQTQTDTAETCPICEQSTCPACQCDTEDGLFLMCEQCATAAAEGIITEVMNDFFSNPNNSLH